MNEPAGAVWVLQNKLNASTDRGTIRLYAHEPEIDPVISVTTRIFEEYVIESVARKHASDLQKDIFTSVVVNVAKSDAMALAEVTGSGTHGDVGEIFPFLVPKHHVGDQRCVRGSAGSQVNIQKTIVIKVSEVGSHGLERPVQPNLLTHVLKRSVAQVFVENGRLCLGRKLHQVTDNFGDRPYVGRCEQIQPAIVVEIEEMHRKAQRGFLHTQVRGNISKGPVPVVVV